jgi:DNA polymerase III epsilon subunit-like protein
MTLIIFDLETTGLSPYTNEIIQIAAVKVTAGRWEETEAFSTFVRPQRRVPSFITGYTGISQAQVQAAPLPAEALMSFSRFIGESATLIAHNGLRFDMPFIREACLRLEIPVRETQALDSCALSRKLWGGRKHGLDVVVERLKLRAEGVRRHDARGDVQLLAEAVKHMWGQLCPDFSTCPVPIKSGVIPMMSHH